MTSLVHKVKLVMVIGNAHVKMVIQDKLAVYVQMDFTRKGIIANLYAQVSLLCINLFDFIVFNAKFIIMRNKRF